MIGPVLDILTNHQDIKTSDASYLQTQQIKEGIQLIKLDCTYELEQLLFPF